jgi:hypothetical protein
MVNIDANNVYLNGGIIDVSGLGYAGGGIGANGSGPTPGFSGVVAGGGGANCGNGGNGIDGIGGFAGASPALFPTTFDYGSGGGGNSVRSGGSGGGKIKIVARNIFDLTNGYIFAYGSSFSDATVVSGGGGGSVWLTAKDFYVHSTVHLPRAWGGGESMGGSSGGGGGGGCLRLDYFVTTSIGTSNSVVTYVVNGGSGQNNGTQGDFRVYQKSAPVLNINVANGVPALTTSLLTWNWGGGFVESKYEIYDVDNTGAIGSQVFASANTTTLSATISGRLPATFYRYAIKSVTTSPGGGIVLISNDTNFTGPFGPLSSAEVVSDSSLEYIDHLKLPDSLSAVEGVITPTTYPVSINYGLNPTTTPITIVDNAGYYYNSNGTRTSTSPAYIQVGSWGGVFSALTPSTSYDFTITAYTPRLDVYGEPFLYYASPSFVSLSTTTPLATPTENYNYFVILVSF